MLQLLMNHYILVPTDFSDVCQNALTHGAEFAKTLNCKLLILHVINKETRAYLARKNKGPEFINVKLRNLAESLQKEYGIEVDYLSRQGSIFKMISQVGIERGATMIVMGTHGKNGMQHLVGSAAIKVISGVEIPVVVVQKRIFGEGFKKIVLPLRLDIDFMDKLEWVVEIAGLFNSEILIFQMDSHDIKVGSAMRNIRHFITSKLEMENINHQVKVADKSEHFSRDLLDYSIINRADMIIATLGKMEVDPLSMSGTEDEKLIYNTSQIPVMCIQPA